MTSTSPGPAGSANIDPERRAGTGQFMLTLCRLPGPVSIRPPQSPQLKPFTFFTTRELGPDGNEHFDLHMGYFETLAGAEKWVEGVRGRFPHAIATIAPTAFMRSPNAEVAGIQPADPEPKVVESSAVTLAEGKSLSDTQVLRILETRYAVRGQDGGEERAREPITLLRPEDTGSRQALKAAVAQGSPVSFAVQLVWSAQPINLSRLPPLAIFKGHTLYATESRREGRSRHFLRLGFFDDPISAKQLAAEVHANFASAAVVPVSDQEVTRVREASKDGSSIPSLVQQEVNRTLDSNSTSGSSPPSQPVSGTRRQVSRDERTLELALRRLARREMWTNPDLLGESGVRHLQVKVETQRRDLSVTADSRTSR